MMVQPLFLGVDMSSLNFCSPPKVHKAFGKLSKRDRNLVMKKLERFQDDPQHFSTFLKGTMAGKREVKVRGDFRVILTMCKECRQLGHSVKIGCADCDQHGDDDVIIFNMGTHKEVY